MRMRGRRWCGGVGDGRVSSECGALSAWGSAALWIMGEGGMLAAGRSVGWRCEMF